MISIVKSVPVHSSELITHSFLLSFKPVYILEQHEKQVRLLLLREIELFDYTPRDLCQIDESMMVNEDSSSSKFAAPFYLATYI